MYEKYAKAVPLHRQEKDFKSKHVPLLKATMSNWVGKAAQEWRLPIVEKMREMLPAGEVIHAIMFNKKKVTIQSSPNFHKVENRIPL